MKKTVFCSLLTILLIGPLCETESGHLWIEEYIMTIPDFPKPGIQFKWYPDLLKNPKAFHQAIKTFANRYEDFNLDANVGLDSRDFIFGTALAYEMNLPFVMMRKKGKLPCQSEKIDYGLEYATASFEIECLSLMIYWLQEALPMLRLHFSNALEPKLLKLPV